jgi:hypothetical protein
VRDKFRISLKISHNEVFTKSTLDNGLHLFEPWANFGTLVAEKVPSRSGWWISEWGGHTIERYVVDSHGVTTEPLMLGESLIEDWDHSFKGNTLFFKFWACFVNSCYILFLKAAAYSHTAASDHAGNWA